MFAYGTYVRRGLKPGVVTFHFLLERTSCQNQCLTIVESNVKFSTFFAPLMHLTYSLGIREGVLIAVPDIATAL